MSRCFSFNSLPSQLCSRLHVYCTRFSDAVRERSKTTRDDKVTVRGEWTESEQKEIHPLVEEERVKPIIEDQSGLG